MPKGIKTIRQMEGLDIAGIACLYCMDSRKCRICKGVGKLPEPHGATIRAVDCWSCHGAKKCPHCSDKRKSA